MKKIILKIVHISENGNESPIYEEDIGEVLNSLATSVLTKVYELTDIISKSKEITNRGDDV